MAWIQKRWWIISALLLAGLYFYGYQKMFFHQDDLDWFLLAQKPFASVMSAPIGDHVDYIFRLLLKGEWNTFHLYFPAYLMVSVIMHAIAVWLLYKLARSTSGRADLAALAALLFTINTNWTEVILWTSGQTISISVIFVLAAMYLIWKKQGEILGLFLAGMTSALALGLPAAAFLTYGFKSKKVLWGSVLSAISVMVVYLWKGSDGTHIEMSLIWGVHVAMVWGLAMVNTVVGRLLWPFDLFEKVRIAVVCGLVIYGLWRGRGKLLQIWRDSWSRFVMIQMGVYYLIVAIGRAQYGIGIMRAERYAYLGLALLLLLAVRVGRKVRLGKWIWIVPMIVIVQCLGLYRRAEDYVVRPQQLKALFEEVKKDPTKVDPGAYLPHFVMNDERLRYSDLMILIND